jgi:hypothetical protein
MCMTVSCMHVNVPHLRLVAGDDIGSPETVVAGGNEAQSRCWELRENKSSEPLRSLEEIGIFPLFWSNPSLRIGAGLLLSGGLSICTTLFCSDPFFTPTHMACFQIC